MRTLLSESFHVHFHSYVHKFLSQPVRTESKGSGMTDAWNTSAGVPSGPQILLALSCVKACVVLKCFTGFQCRGKACVLFWGCFECFEITLSWVFFPTHTSAALSSKSRPVTAALDPSSRHKEVPLHYRPIVKQAENRPNCWWYSNRSDLQCVMTITLIPLRVVRSNSLTIILLIFTPPASSFHRVWSEIWF